MHENEFAEIKRCKKQLGGSSHGDVVEIKGVEKTK